MSKRFIYTLGITVGLLVLYGVFAVVAYTQSRQSGAPIHKTEGHIQAITVNAVPTWGFQSDRSLAHPLRQKFRFADLPGDWQLDGQHVVIEYQIQDVIGGEWGVIIHIVSIQKN